MKHIQVFGSVSENLSSDSNLYLVTYLNNEAGAYAHNSFFSSLDEAVEFAEESMGEDWGDIGSDDFMETPCCIFIIPRNIKQGTVTLDGHGAASETKDILIYTGDDNLAWQNMK